jgi:hypothetical protein
MPDLNGVEVLQAVKEISPRLAVVMMTAHGTIKSAVDAMKLGAFDYVTKPFDVDEIKLTVKNACEHSRLIEENIQLKRALKSRYRFDEIIGDSGKMQEVYKIIERVADSPATVLVRGESGTGKELVARAIHYNSRRSGKPFVAVSCAALPETLLESELFGHEKGAFTGAASQKAGRFELSHKGTLFLDEISEIPPSVQVKLLRVQQEKEFERIGGTKTLPPEGLPSCTGADRWSDAAIPWTHRSGQPLLVQFGEWLFGRKRTDGMTGEEIIYGGVMRGNLGYSPSGGESNIQVIREQLPRTLELVLLSLPLMATGVWASLR